MTKDWVDIDTLIAFVQKERTSRFARGNVLLQLGHFTTPKTRTDVSLADRLATLRIRFNAANASTKSGSE